MALPTSTLRSLWTRSRRGRLSPSMADEGARGGDRDLPRPPARTIGGRSAPAARAWAGALVRGRRGRADGPVRGGEDGKAGEARFHNHALDLMHVNDAAAAIVDVLRHQGPLEPVYNLEGFQARASEIVADIGSLRPGAEIALDVIEPPLLFPLISGARLRADIGFAARYDRRAFAAALLA